MLSSISKLLVGLLLLTNFVVSGREFTKAHLRARQAQAAKRWGITPGLDRRAVPKNITFHNPKASRMLCYTYYTFLRIDLLQNFGLMVNLSLRSTSTLDLVGPVYYLSAALLMKRVRLVILSTPTVVLRLGSSIFT